MFKTKSLPDYVLSILHDKDTEQPFLGEYNNTDQAGSYLCRQCGLVLFRSNTKFHSGCGWPSFDEAIPDSIKREKDKDGKRIEILCQQCNAHLGHIFLGEKFTHKNTRYCVNSLSLDFVPTLTVKNTEEAIFAAGCFWGVQYYFNQLEGVLKTEVGYTGGQVTHPTYEAICLGNTGHYEAIRIIYDPDVIDYKALTTFFFEIHNFSQSDGQGPDIGQQYLSVIFYYNDTQKKIVYELIDALKNLGHVVTTQVLPVNIFWRAENYHQDYYTKMNKKPYCHFYNKKFR